MNLFFYSFLEVMCLFYYWIFLIIVFRIYDLIKYFENDKFLFFEGVFNFFEEIVENFFNIDILNKEWENIR